MADIRVHPAERRTPWWVWSLALLLAAAVVAFFVLVAGGADGADLDPSSADTTSARPASPGADTTLR